MGFGASSRATNRLKNQRGSCTNMALSARIATCADLNTALNSRGNGLLH